MATPKDSSREAHFPAIEKKYGEKMSYWFKVMKELSGQKYPEQIAYLRENCGFSQAHANALVMFSRGSTSSKRFETPKEYFATLTAVQAKTVKAIFKVIQSKNPDLELVIAWLLRFVSTKSFMPFIIYRILLGSTVLVLLATGVINA